MRAFGKQDLKGAAEAWQKILDVAPSSEEARAAQQALDGLRSAHPDLGIASKPQGSRSVVIGWLLRLILVCFVICAACRGCCAASPQGMQRAARTSAAAGRRRSCAIRSAARSSSRRRRSRSAPAPAIRYFCSEECRRAYVIEGRAMTERELRDGIVEVGRRLYARGYTASNDGNISVRLDGGRLLMTPKSVCKGFMTADMMVVTDLDGKKLAGERDPSSEMQMHLEVYRQRPDARAVVHAHPPIATAFAVAGIPLDRAVLAEVVTTLGSVPIAEYATPSTKELPEAVRKYVKAHDGMLLANHGALTLGADLFAAYYKMETIEHFAKISLVARLLGGERLLSREEVDRLQGLRGMYGIAAPAPICPIRRRPTRSALCGDPATCQTVFAPETRRCPAGRPIGRVKFG